jgi:hypothetical protein
MKINVGITNKVDILGDHWAVDAHVAYFSILFIRYSGIDHFEISRTVFSSFFKRRSILAVSMSTSSSW